MKGYSAEMAAQPVSPVQQQQQQRYLRLKKNGKAQIWLRNQSALRSSSSGSNNSRGGCISSQY